jgi:hypothetical protein
MAPVKREIKPPSRRPQSREIVSRCTRFEMVNSNWVGAAY